MPGAQGRQFALRRVKERETALRSERDLRIAAMPAAPARPLAPDVKLREVWAWSMYDFANSAYTTVVITAVFGAYFVSAVTGNKPWGTFAWTAALSVSNALVLAAGPVIGAWADAHAAKKRLLFFTTVGCVLATAGLALA